MAGFPENEQEGAGAREAMLERGKELAAQTIFQYERWARCPFNGEESARLRGLQNAFAAWERTAKAQCPDLDTAALFADTRLRPFHRELGISYLARLRRTPSILEAHMISVIHAYRAQHPIAGKEQDDGIWPSAGPGI